MIVVNFKRYPEAAGENAVHLAQICQNLQQELGIQIVPVPNVADLQGITDLGIECWTQRFEPQESVQKGTLLNHSDFRLEHSGLQEEYYLSRSRGDEVCICAQNVGELPFLLQLKPKYLLYEPPELIGSTSTSVAKSQPEIIDQAAEICLDAKIPLMVGAGIKSAEDVRVSLEHGAMGVGVASAIVLAVNQEQKLRELAEAFKI